MVTPNSIESYFLIVHLSFCVKKSNKYVGKILYTFGEVCGICFVCEKGVLYSEFAYVVEMHSRIRPLVFMPDTPLGPSKAAISGISLTPICMVNSVPRSISQAFGSLLKRLSSISTNY